MSRRFQRLLNRYTAIRRAIDLERNNLRPSPMRLMRLKRLQLLLSERIRAFVKLSAIRRAAVPRFVPAVARQYRPIGMASSVRYAGARYESIIGPDGLALAFHRSDKVALES